MTGSSSAREREATLGRTEASAPPTASRASASCARSRTSANPVAELRLHELAVARRGAERSTCADAASSAASTASNSSVVNPLSGRGRSRAAGSRGAARSMRRCRPEPSDAMDVAERDERRPELAGRVVRSNASTARSRARVAVRVEATRPPPRRMRIPDRRSGGIEDGRGHPSRCFNPPPPPCSITAAAAPAQLPRMFRDPAEDGQPRRCAGHVQNGCDSSANISARAAKGECRHSPTRTRSRRRKGGDHVGPAGENSPQTSISRSSSSGSARSARRT